MKPLPDYLPLPLRNPRLLVPDGPARVMARSFLLYAPCSRRGKALRAVGIAASRLGLFRLLCRWHAVRPDGLFSDMTISPILSRETLMALWEAWEAFFKQPRIFCAFSTGTPERYRKVTALLFDSDGEILGLAKIGATPQAVKLIEHEFHTLKWLRQVGLSRGITPEPLCLGGTGGIRWMLQSVLKGGRPSPLKLLPFHYSFQAEIAALTRREGRLGDTSLWKGLVSRTSDSMETLFAQSVFPRERTFFDDLFRECRDVLPGAGNLSWPLVAAHGDFAPWNIRKISGKAAVYDWENFLPLAPAGWDVLYHEIRVKILVRGWSLARTFSECCRSEARTAPLSAWEMKTGIHIPDRRLLTLLLFFDLCYGASRRGISEGEIVTAVNVDP